MTDSSPASVSFPPAAAPSARSRKKRRIAAWLGPVVVVALAAAGYALAHPERMPAGAGLWIENHTGANPRPIALHRPPVKPLSAEAQLGEKLFYDTSLSASGKQSCASCHSPDRAYGPPNDLSVQLGGPGLDQAGYRPPPSLAYLYRQPEFGIGPDVGEVEAPPDLAQAAAAAAQGAPRAQKAAGVAAAPAMVPQGGMFWDGRAATLQIQAAGPLLNPVEMANTSREEVVRKLEHSPYADTFKRMFGPNIFKTPGLLMDEAMFVIGRYQIESESFHAFSSKYDLWLEGKARLTQQELRGMRLFNDPNKANCAGCHVSQPTPDGLPPLFTDMQYEALGVPRNPKIPANADPAFYDLGICGPFRTDLKDQTQYCGMFLTPTLRNSAGRGVYFHNGVYHTLEQVMDFYNLRNTSPEKIYPRDASGQVMKYDDIPPQYRDNVDSADAPFDRKLGDAPALTDDEIKDVIAFLKTLSDGYGAPAQASTK